MFKNIFRKLFPRKSHTDFPAGYITHKFLTKRVDKDPILIIGDFTVKDYRFLSRRFDDVYLLDIVNNDIVEGKYFIKQSVTNSLPFPDGKFNYILLLEVIEHVWEDKKVLEEIHRVLNKKGRLLLSTPFYNDKPNYHYHIYSPKTIERLLNHSGFKIEKYSFRGLVMSIPNFIIAFLSMLLYPAFKENSLKIVNNFLYKIHIKLDKSGLNQLSRRFGTLIISRKAKAFNSLEIQKSNLKNNNESYNTSRW